MTTWMIVAEDPISYEVLLIAFEIWDIEGVAFVDGEEGVAWIDDVDAKRFQGELPKLALLELSLPGKVDGVAVGERLRKSPILGNISIALTSAFKLTADEQAEAMQKTQADLWLPRPLPKFNELVGILGKVIAEQGSGF